VEVIVMRTGPAPTPATRRAPRRLTVVYDETCALCRRCREWLATEPVLVDVEFVAAGSEVAEERYGALPWLGAELVVVAEDGRAWVGPAAFLVCLWATQRWRSWSFRLSGGLFAPMAERFFHFVSGNRRRIGGMLASPECEWCDRPGVRPKAARS
jgi:predicted DCC family thiol-disulfide oxidoreductase YuxK